VKFELQNCLVNANDKSARRVFANLNASDDLKSFEIVQNLSLIAAADICRPIVLHHDHSSLILDKIAHHLLVAHDSIKRVALRLRWNSAECDKMRHLYLYIID